MPNYNFTNQETGETQEFFYHMKEAPSVGSTVEIDGEKWKRVFARPEAAPNGLKALDPHSNKQFVEKTGKMKGTLGDLLDLSKEMSERRAEKAGANDPVREKFFADYSAKRRGTPHTAQLAERQQKAIKQFNEGLRKLGLA